ncbi:hypothetical protein DYB34_013137, partial [Aphanomyces astaci]
MSLTDSRLSLISKHHPCMPAGPKLTEEEQAMILALTAVGKGHREIERLLSRSRSAIAHFLRDPAGYNINKRSGRPPKDAIASSEGDAASLFRDDEPDLTPPTPPVLVASNVSLVETQRFFESRVASLATFVYYDATGDIFVVKVPNMEG